MSDEHTNEGRRREQMNAARTAPAREVAFAQLASLHRIERELERIGDLLAGRRTS